MTDLVLLLTGDAPRAITLARLIGSGRLSGPERAAVRDLAAGRLINVCLGRPGQPVIEVRLANAVRQGAGR